MNFYILMKDDTELSTMQDANRLGYITYTKKFQPNLGMKVLKKLIREESDKLSDVRIYDQTGKKYGIEEFLDYINKYEIKEAPE